ncbi:MAG: septum formation initiator [Flavobacteriales bacterium]|nr:septum formation initiator [Flavobacteriales bacterium]|tara:strand:+ start:3135 stop:3422 length:288 start_codon:yes stop_codon:yes gene_type:complete
MKKIPNWLKNRYLLSAIIFTIWMTFFDTSSLLVKYQKNKEIKKLENDVHFYQNEIKKDQNLIKILSSDSLTPELEKYLREEIFLSKKNEEIFIIN